MHVLTAQTVSQLLDLGMQGITVLKAVQRCKGRGRLAAGHVKATVRFAVLHWIRALPSSGKRGRLQRLPPAAVQAPTAWSHH